MDDLTHLPDFLAVQAEGRGDKIALVCGDRRVTYQQLNARANRCAHVLAGLGVVPGDRVSSFGFNSIEGAETAHATRKVKAVSVPLSYRLAAPELAYVVTDSDARVLLVGPEQLEVAVAARELVTDGHPRHWLLRGPGEPPPGWQSYEALLAASDESEPTSAGGGSVGASMIYTSGTTGHPKGAYRPHGIDIQNVLQAVATFGISGDDVHLMAGPGYHSAVAFFSYLHSLLGATVVIQPRFEAGEALRLISTERVTTTFMAPTLVRRILDLPAERLEAADTSCLRALILGAAPCPHALKERAEAFFGQVLWEFYGSTETGINTVLRPEDQLRKPNSCGTAVDGQEIRLLDPEGQEVADGEPGEFHVRTSWQAEYFNRPGEQRSTSDGFVSVGDIAYRDSEGYYFICDRAVDMIISGGVNIYPAEVEAVLHTHPAVADAAVFGIPSDEFGESVHAMVELRPGAAVEPDDLVAHCRTQLAGYKCPRTLEIATELPRSVDGKLRKRALREPFWVGSERRI